MGCDEVVSTSFTVVARENRDFPGGLARRSSIRFTDLGTFAADFEIDSFIDKESACPILSFTNFPYRSILLSVELYLSMETADDNAFPLVLATICHLSAPTFAYRACRTGFSLSRLC